MPCHNKVDAVILCGGRGSRLGNLTTHVPKPLIPVMGKPILFRMIDQLENLSVRRIIIIGGYLAEKLEQDVFNYLRQYKKQLDVIVTKQLYLTPEDAIFAEVT